MSNSRASYRGRETGLESTAPAGWLLEFRNGKIVMFRAFREPGKAMEATGLS